MTVPLPPEIQPTNEMMRLVAGIDDFKGEWRAISERGPEALSYLRRIATIESIGSSTRIEGARLSDREVETLLGRLWPESFQSRDEQEVAGYAATMELVQNSWADLRLSEGILLQLHRDLLGFSSKDERHRGAWKTFPNHVVAFDSDGREMGIVFETASPFDTPRLMQQLLDWHAAEELGPTLHPLIRIAVFTVVFLAIHPFQDGNGRLSRVITNLLLLRAGYAFASYSSLESVIEHNKEGYYRSLRASQTTFSDTGGRIDWASWLVFYLRAMTSQIDRLRGRLRPMPARVAPSADPARAGLSPLAARLLDLLTTEGTLSVAAASNALGANRNTLKGKFGELIRAGLAELHGKGRGAHYRVRRANFFPTPPPAPGTQPP